MVSTFHPYTQQQVSPLSATQRGYTAYLRLRRSAIPTEVFDGGKCGILNEAQNSLLAETPTSLRMRSSIGEKFEDHGPTAELCRLCIAETISPKAEQISPP